MQNELVGLPIQYGIKSPDMFFFDIGFGDSIIVPDYDGTPREVSEYALHYECYCEVIWRDGSKQIEKLYDDTSCDKFHAIIKKLIGHPIKRVGLSTKNDLWLDLGVCWMVFITNEDDNESWRFFSLKDEEAPHIIASKVLLAYDDEF